MQPAYYEDFKEIKKKIWSMLENAVTDRSSPFRIPVFICGNQSDLDGRIVVLRKADIKNNLVQLKKFKSKCPTCKKKSQYPFSPFCSKKCADLDLMKWLSDQHQININ